MGRWKGCPRRDRGVVGRLGSGFRLLAVTVNVFLGSKRKRAELDGCSVHLTIAGHSNCLLLVQYPSLIARHTSGPFSGSLDGRGNISTRWWWVGLVLLLGR
jgi:hypothetical protein